MPTKKAAGDVSNAEILRFLKQTVATKEDLRTLATKAELQRVERDLHHKLDGIGKRLTDREQEHAAHQAAHDRFDRRDHVFAGKLNVDLAKVDAEA